MSIPCRTRYHESCFRLTKPFLTRLAKEQGLGIPTGFGEMIPAFICECCTVRAVLRRELHPSHRDTILLMLERMRIIDMAHNWAHGTITTYRSKIKMIRRFETTFGCQILQTPNLTRPPANEAIPLMWVQQHYSLQSKTWTRSTNVMDPDEDRVSFATLRGLRSAASLYGTWHSMLEHPGNVIRERDSKRPILTLGAIPTDGIEYALMATGMGRRLGIASTPSVALTAAQVHWINRYLERAYQRARKDPARRREIILAALCNCAAWLAWLRGGEVFGLNWKDVCVRIPNRSIDHTKRFDLVGAMGSVKLRLLEQTKTCQSSVADVALAFCSGSGLPIGSWILRARQELSHPGTNWANTAAWEQDERPLFQHPNGTRWTSTYYRQNYLLPLLQAQRLEGDPALQAYDGSAGKTLAEAFYSMHSYRSGGRSHVSQRREGCKRMATLTEINEHGRWRHRRSSETMSEQYRQWDLAERLAITLLCM
jgi:hypothetical protein